ncbi:MAG: hypothetical protein NT062_11335 [Proteobacteria bacterium]|nr:hypothetical protein [Pseudomonadota bacterium]
MKTSETQRRTRVFTRVHADPPPDPAPIDLSQRGRFPIARRRPDGTIELVTLPKR